MEIVVTFRGAKKLRGVQAALDEVHGHHTPISYRHLSSSETGAQWQSILVAPMDARVDADKLHGFIMRTKPEVRVSCKPLPGAAKVRTGEPLTPGQLHARQKAASNLRAEQALRMAAPRSYIEWSVRGKDLGNRLDALLTQARSHALATNPNAPFPTWSTDMRMPHFIFKATLPVPMSADDCERVLRGIIAANPGMGVTPDALRMRSPVSYLDNTQAHASIGLPAKTPGTLRMAYAPKGKRVVYHRVVCVSAAQVQAVGEMVSRTVLQVKPGCHVTWELRTDQPDYMGQPVCMLENWPGNKAQLEGIFGEFAQVASRITPAQLAGHKVIVPITYIGDEQKLDDARTALGKAQRRARGIEVKGVEKRELTTEEKFLRAERAKEREFEKWKVRAIAEAVEEGRILVPAIEPIDAPNFDNW